MACRLKPVGAQSKLASVTSSLMLSSTWVWRDAIHGVAGGGARVREQQAGHAGRQEQSRKQAKRRRLRRAFLRNDPWVSLASNMAGSWGGCPPRKRRGRSSRDSPASNRAHRGSPRASC